MKNINLIFFISIITLIVACSKDTRTIRKLDGIWNVDRIEFSQTRVKTTNKKDSSFFKFENVGTYEFYKDRTSNGNYRGGFMYVKFPVYYMSSDTLEAQQDSSNFTFFVDQIQGSDKQKIGIIDSLKVYRQCIIDDELTDRKNLAFTYEFTRVLYKKKPLPNKPNNKVKDSDSKYWYKFYLSKK